MPTLSIAQSLSGLVPVVPSKVTISVPVGTTLPSQLPESDQSVLAPSPFQITVAAPAFCKDTLGGKRYILKGIRTVREMIVNKRKLKRKILNNLLVFKGLKK